MVRLTDRLNMTLAGDWEVKPHTKQSNKQTKTSLELASSLCSDQENFVRGGPNLITFFFFFF